MSRGLLSYSLKTQPLFNFRATYLDLGLLGEASPRAPVHKYCPVYAAIVTDITARGGTPCEDGADDDFSRRDRL